MELPTILTQPFYVVIYTTENKGFIVSDWATCEELCKGHARLMKKFNTYEEMAEWIKSITPRQIEMQEYMAQRKDRNVPQSVPKSATFVYDDDLPFH